MGWYNTYIKKTDMILSVWQKKQGNDFVPFNAD